jgi:hypothetical protein
MNRIHPHSLGFAFGIFLALWHTLWSLLVWLGAAQWLIDFIFRLHMITPPYKITAFSFGTAASLVLVTACIGYMVGLLIGIIWNRCSLRPTSN